MQLNISRNTVIATPIVEEHIIAALKAKYNNIMFVDVDLLKGEMAGSIYGDKAPNFLEYLLHSLVRSAIIGSGRLEHSHLLFEILFNYIKDKLNSLPDFILFRLVNAEPFLLVNPLGRLDAVAMLSYLFDYDLALANLDIATDVSGRGNDYYPSLVEVANALRGRFFLIISKL